MQCNARYPESSPRAHFHLYSLPTMVLLVDPACILIRLDDLTSNQFLSPALRQQVAAEKASNVRLPLLGLLAFETNPNQAKGIAGSAVELKEWT